MSTPVQPLTLLVVAIAGWLQRDQRTAIVYLLEETRVFTALLGGRKLRLTDDLPLMPVCPSIRDLFFADHNPHGERNGFKPKKTQ